MERLDKEKQEEISQMKIRFYVNISHELRTPLPPRPFFTW
jgi:signal transduction histidine kinase